VKKIYLRNIDRYALINDDDFPRVDRFHWYGYKSKKDYYFYARAHEEVGRYLNGAIKYKTHQLHRFILELDDPKEEVTFRNHNPLDCQRKNMVVTTRSMVRANGRAVKGAKRMRGVVLHDGKYYRAIAGNVTIGYFRSEYEAALAYDMVARQKFGELAQLNYPNVTDYSNVQRRRKKKRLEGHSRR